MASLDLSEGAIFAGQFKVLRPLAKGGMGAVYVVEQLGTKRERALKLMHPMLVTDPRSRERFEREAQVSARIDSDHVVEVIAAGIEQASGTPWLCMELLKGEELAARMERGPLPQAEAIEVFKQLGHALAAAHAAGIIHRDLKPENVFLATARREGAPFTLKVLDFGVATLVHEASGKSNATQGVGSPLWMAPEQTNVGTVSPATDVWALGLLAYHCLTGAMYWKSANEEGSTITALLVEVMVESLVPASQRAREQGVSERLPPGFDAWFARCVVREPGARFAEAGQATQALVELLRTAPGWLPAGTPAALAATMNVQTSPHGAPVGAGSAALLPTMNVPTAPHGGTTGPGASASIPGTAPMAVSAPPAGPAASMPSPAIAPPPARGTPWWAWALGGLFAALLTCGVGMTYVLVRGMDALETAAASGTGPHLTIDGENGDLVTVGAGGVVVRDGDGDTVTMTPLAAPAADAGPPDAGMPDAGEPEPTAVAVEGETSNEGSDEAEATPAPRPTHRTGSSGGSSGGRSSGPIVTALRARLDRCVNGNLAGEPRARWTFTLNFGPTGRVSGVRTDGPHFGETSGPYATFRRCVQVDLAGFDSGGDRGPFVIRLP